MNSKWWSAQKVGLGHQSCCLQIRKEQSLFKKNMLASSESPAPIMFILLYHKIFLSSMLCYGDFWSPCPEIKMYNFFF